jgi:hypothetical protein
MNYSKKAEEIRQAMKPVRIQAGKWLLLHLSRSWSAGEAAFIPAGTYWMTQSITLPSGSQTYGEEGSTLCFSEDVAYAFEIIGTPEEAITIYGKTVLRLNHVRLGFDN